jgi:inner membrane protein
VARFRAATNHTCPDALDSLTQFALGAALGASAFGHRAGARAALIGGALATLPDLDVFVSYADPIESFTYHRSASHSVIVLTLVAPLFAYLINWLQPLKFRDFKGWLWLAWLCLVTHPLLDGFTVYGTQLLWPLTEHPFGLGSIFIIDPLYTVPLLVGVVCAVTMRKRVAIGRRFNGIGLGLSTAYLLASVGVQAYVTDVAEGQLGSLKRVAQAPLVIPTPFNALLWRVVVVAPDAYHVAYYSLVTPRPLRFETFSNDSSLVTDAPTTLVERLRWFTKGYNSVVVRDGRVVIADLRMGFEPSNYVFSFAVGARDGQDTRFYEVSDRLPAPPPSAAALGRFFERLMTGR